MNRPSWRGYAAVGALVAILGPAGAGAARADDHGNDYGHGYSSRGAAHDDFSIRLDYGRHGGGYSYDRHGYGYGGGSPYDRYDYGHSRGYGYYGDDRRQGDSHAYRDYRRMEDHAYRDRRQFEDHAYRDRRKREDHAYRDHRERDRHGYRSH